MKFEPARARMTGSGLASCSRPEFRYAKILPCWLDRGKSSGAARGIGSQRAARSDATRSPTYWRTGTPYPRKGMLSPPSPPQQYIHHEVTKFEEDAKKDDRPLCPSIVRNTQILPCCYPRPHYDTHSNFQTPPPHPHSQHIHSFTRNGWF